MAAGKGGKYFIGARKDGCSPNGLCSAGARPSPFFSAPWGEKCFPFFILPLGGGRSQRSEDPSTSSDGGRRGKREEGEEDHFVPIKRGGPLFPSFPLFFLPFARKKAVSRSLL